MRNASAAIGRREQRQAVAKERWALDQEGETNSALDASQESTPEDLQSALADLPDDSREALVLFYFQGESTASAAEIVGISEGAFEPGSPAPGPSCASRSRGAPKKHSRNCVRREI